MDVAKVQLLKWARAKLDFDVLVGTDVILDVLDEYLKEPQVSGLSLEDKQEIFDKFSKILNKDNDVIFNNWRNTHFHVWKLMKTFAREKIGHEAFTEATLKLCLNFISAYTTQWDRAVVECMRCLTNMFHHNKGLIDVFDNDANTGVVVITRALQRTNDCLIDDQDKDNLQIITAVQFLCLRLLLQVSNVNAAVLKKLSGSQRVADAIYDCLDFHTSKMADEPNFESHFKDKSGESHAETVSEALRFAYVIACNEFGRKPVTSLLRQESYGLTASQSLLSPSPSPTKEPQNVPASNSKLVRIVPVVISLFECLKVEWARAVKMPKDAKDDDPYFSKRSNKSSTSALVRTFTGGDLPNYLKFLLAPWSFAIHFLLQFSFPDDDDESEAGLAIQNAWFPKDEGSDQPDLKLIDMLGYFVAVNVKRLEQEKKEPSVESMDPKHPKNVLPSLLTLVIKLLTVSRPSRKLLKSRLLPHSMDKLKQLTSGDKTYNHLARLLSNESHDVKIQQQIGDLFWLLCDENPHRLVFYVGKTLAQPILNSRGFKTLPQPGADAVDDEGNPLDEFAQAKQPRSSSAIDLSYKDPQFNEMITKIEKSMRVSEKDRATPSPHSSIRNLSGKY